MGGGRESGMGVAPITHHEEVSRRWKDEEGDEGEEVEFECC